MQFHGLINSLTRKINFENKYKVFDFYSDKLVNLLKFKLLKL